MSTLQHTGYSTLVALAVFSKLNQSTLMRLLKEACRKDAL